MSRDLKHSDSTAEITAFLNKTDTSSKNVITHLARYHRYVLALAQAKASGANPNQIEIYQARVDIQIAILYHPFNQFLFNLVAKAIEENSNIDMGHVLVNPQVAFKRILCEIAKNHQALDFLNHKPEYMHQWLSTYSKQLRDEFIKFLSCELKMFLAEHEGLLQKILIAKNINIDIAKREDVNKENANSKPNHNNLTQINKDLRKLLLRYKKILANLEQLIIKIKPLINRIDELLHDKNDLIQKPDFIALLQEKKQSIKIIVESAEKNINLVKKAILVIQLQMQSNQVELDKFSVAPLASKKTGILSHNNQLNRNIIFKAIQPNGAVKIKQAAVVHDEKRTDPSLS